MCVLPNGKEANGNNRDSCGISAHSLGLVLGGPRRPLDTGVKDPYAESLERSDSSSVSSEEDEYNKVGKKGKEKSKEMKNGAKGDQETAKTEKVKTPA